MDSIRQVPQGPRSDPTRAKMNALIGWAHCAPLFPPTHPTPLTHHHHYLLTRPNSNQNERIDWEGARGAMRPANQCVHFGSDGDGSVWSIRSGQVAK